MSVKSIFHTLFLLGLALCTGLTLWAQPAGRVSSGLQAVYVFDEGAGSTVNDVSGVGTALNLTVDNPAHTSWLAGNGLAIFQDVSLESSGAASKIISACQSSNELTVEAWLRADNTTQDGPARIVSVSSGTSARNFTMGQENGRYSFRVRAGSSNNNGTSNELLTSSSTVDPSQWQHVVMTIANGTQRIYVDGVQVANNSNSGDFSNWDGSYQLLLGNETTHDREWFGELGLVAVYSEALTAAEISQNYNAGYLLSTPTPPTVVGTCTLTRYLSNDHVLWLPGAPQGSDFISDGPLILTEYSDGTATITGRVMAINDNAYKWDVDFHFRNKRDWTEWSALGRGAKGANLGDETTWTYYELVSSSTLTGAGAMAGTNLTVSPRPVDYHYGLQIGQGANDKDGDFGLSTWFYYDGDYSGHGDVNADISCGSTPSPCGNGYSFFEDNGLISIEAENYDENNIRADANDWEIRTNSGAYSGTGYVEVPDGTASGTGSWTSSAQLVYDVDFTSTGTWYVFGRVIASAGNDNSGRFGVDGVQSSSNYNGSSVNSWTWVSFGTVTVSTAGIKAIELVRREDGFEVDKFVFSTSNSMPTGMGPVETNCGGSTPPPPPPSIMPPTPATCANGNLLWENMVDVTNLSGNNGIPATTVRLRGTNNGPTSYTLPISLPAAFNGPVDISIDEAISWDGYTNRPNVGNQPNEQWRVAFFLNGTLQWASAYTQDIADGPMSAEWSGPLGSVTLPNGADEIRIIHFEDADFGTGNSSSANSVVPTSICISYAPAAVPSPPPANWLYTCADDVEMEIVGIGMTGQSTASLALTDLASIDSVVLEAVSKNGTPPVSVTFSNGTQTLTAAAQAVGQAPNGNSNSSVRVYRTQIDPAATVSIANAGSNMHSFVAYVFRSGTGNGGTHAGQMVQQYFYRGDDVINIAIPTDVGPRNISLEIPVSEMTNDSRIARFSASAGTASATATINTYNQGNSLNIVSLNLANVPGNVTNIELTIESPNGGSPSGDSYVVGGYVVANINCFSCPVDLTATGGEIDCDSTAITLTADGGSGTPPLPGLNYAYYELGSSLSQLPNFSLLTPANSGTIANFDISPALVSSYFAFRFTGYIEITTAGTYTFYTHSDDGSKLYIDGVEIVDNDGLHAAQEESGTVSLTAGLHAIEVTFFENTGGQVLDVSYAGPGMAKQLIPSGVLYQNLGTAFAYAWTGPNGFSSSNQNPSVSETGFYTVVVTDPISGCADTATVEVTTCNVPVQPLHLTSLCSDDPLTVRRWRVRNANNFPVAYEWDVYGTTQVGDSIAPPGDSYFFTQTVGGANTTRIRWEDENGATQQRVRASGGALCSTGEAALGDYVFADANGNGVQDSSEAGVAGVAVQLFICGQASPLESTVTDSNGLYLFEGLLPSRGYYVRFDSTTFPANTTFTQANAGGDEARDSDADPATGNTDCYTPAPGETYLDLDLGLKAGCELADGGQIEGDQTFCIVRGENVDPALISSVDLPGNDVGPFEYEWLYSFDCNLPFEEWVVKKFANGPEYDPNPAKKTYCMVRRARRCPGEPWQYSNIVTLTINYIPGATFAYVNDTTCVNNERTLTFEATKVNGVTYTWSFPGSNDMDGEPVAGVSNNRAVTTTYPAAGGAFQATLTLSNGDCDSTLTLDVMVDPCNTCDNVGEPGILSGVDASCLIPFDPGPIAGSAAKGGDEAATLTYEWYYTTSPGLPVQDWEVVAGYSGKNYNPGPLTETTYFIRGAKRDGCVAFVNTNVVTIEVDSSVQTKYNTWQNYSMTHSFELPGVTNNPVHGDLYAWSGIEGGKFTTYDDERARFQGLIENTSNPNLRWFANMNMTPRMDWIEWQNSASPYAGTFQTSGAGGSMDHYTWDYYEFDTNESYFIGFDWYGEDSLFITGGYMQIGVGANGVNTLNGIYATFTFSSASGDYSGTGTFWNKFTNSVAVCPPSTQMAARIVLEGPYNPSTGEMETDLAAQELIPSTQPFNTAPWDYAGTESFDTLPSSDIVDWVLMEFRSSSDSTQLVHQFAALLDKSGDLLDPSGQNLAYADLPFDSTAYYVVIRSRNHLAIMASIKVTRMGRVFLYNFTQAGSAYNNPFGIGAPVEEVQPGVYGMIMGDDTGNGIVNAADIQQIVFNYFMTGALGSDVDLTGVTNAADIQKAILRYFRRSHVPPAAN